MKSTLYVLFSALYLSYCISLFLNTSFSDPNDKGLNRSGYSYAINVSKINSKYSEIPTSTFRNKLVLVSSKKIGGLGNGKNPLTNQPYTNLFCADIKAYGELGTPLLFSRILNTKGNEGQIAFSPDEHTVYYTRSTRQDPDNYKLYMAKLEPNSYGNWIDHIELAINSEENSIQHPHVSADGKHLYFSSDREGGFGGFDLYVSQILEDGSVGEPVNLGPTINTKKDEAYPYSSADAKELYFSSQGHGSLGGYDIFIANSYQKSFSLPRNLGEGINSKQDDIAFMFIDEQRGVFSSNRNQAPNTFNMYRFKARALYQELRGIVISEEDKILPNTTVVLLNAFGEEIERQTNISDASYTFKIKPYQEYQLRVEREGFKDYRLELQSDDEHLKAILKLSSRVGYVPKTK